MTIYVFDCSIDNNVKLLLPSKIIPVGAAEHCRRPGNFPERGQWKFSKQLDDFQPDDTRLAIDSQKATQDIQAQGLHIGRFSISTKENKH